MNRCDDINCFQFDDDRVVYQHINPSRSDRVSLVSYPHLKLPYEGDATQL